MNTSTEATWLNKRTDETRAVEAALTDAGFLKADAYRYNSATIRLRVVDPRFAGRTREERDAMVEPVLAQLPERTQADIVSLFTFTSEEVEHQTPQTFREFMLNSEFEHPSPSML